MRFDEVDLDAAGAGRISDAQFVERLDVPHGRVGHPAFDQERGGFQAVTHIDLPLVSMSEPVWRSQIATNG